jgi:hypothetical protein
MSTSAVVFSDEDLLVQEESPPAAVPSSKEKVWIGEVWDQLASISGLTHNWDSYGGRPMSLTAASAAVDFLEYLGAECAVPKIKLMASGGLQMEWEGPDYEVSLEVAPSRRIGVMLAPVDGDPFVDEVGLSWSDVLDRHFDQLKNLLPGRGPL